MRTRNILTAEQSRAEQSRAEQSRAEQSRAEQSRAGNSLPICAVQNQVEFAISYKAKRRFDDTG